MDRLFESNVSGTPPSMPSPGASGYPQNGGAGSSPTVPGAYWYHAVTESLRNVIVSAGLTPDASDLMLLAEAIQALSGAVMPAGAVAHFARATAPDGWLIADGALVSRTTYAALWQAIGTTFGAGDGSTTFALPDLRGEFLRGVDLGRGVDAGRVLGSHQSDDFKSHYHGYPEGGWDVNGAGSGTKRVDFGDDGPYAGVTVDMAAGGTETRPRNIALLACIKV